eukprot:2754283-Prymnesium_polylepis.1
MRWGVGGRARHHGRACPALPVAMSPPQSTTRCDQSARLCLPRDEHGAHESSIGRGAVHDRGRAAVARQTRDVAPGVLHELAAGTQIGGEQVVRNGHRQANAAAAAAVRTLETHAPRPCAVGEHPVALHATASEVGDAARHGHSHRRRPTEHGPGAATRIRAARLQLSEQEWSAVIVLREQVELRSAESGKAGDRASRRRSQRWRAQKSRGEP